MIKDMATLIGGFLTALLLFFGTIGVSFEWFTQDSINAFVVLISAAIALGINLYAVYKNTYVLTKKAKLQKEFLERNNLK
ncbi:phage holin [Cytobacillus dafuensis]|uniref:PTS mannose transporter subunit IID n=1 Tax=Cytobacillus dafuensis TaxID=1742359 RepID=A0A5B8ZCU0_CYTDA|nr:phage holin [Cytobacillus dafuensis]QED49336.1 PTS mannose transporter subunit IID [Cytobacillus dafuensis]